MKKYISALLSIVIISLMIPGTMIHAAKVNGKNITSQGACVMDYETGEILYEYNGYKKRVPASMTKIMNMYLIYEALAKGEISLNTKVPISKNVYDKSRNKVYQSVLPLYYNNTYTVDEMMDVIVVYSASGAAIAMAELIGGTEAEYVKRMNNKAKEMGIDAVYYDSCGIADNQISPVGMATLARNIIRDYPDILTRSSKKSVSFHGGKYSTTNKLLGSHYYEGADGLKTGTTGAAGYCFCGTAVRNGKRMISVTMSSSSTGQRFVDTATLLDYGFSVAPASKENVYFTDMSTFINGHEVPTFAYKGEGDTTYAVVIAEDLVNYGFDVNFTNKTLYLTYNEKKSFNPMDIEYYKNKNNELAYPVQANNEISIVLNDGLKEYTLSNVHNLNGYMCFSVDEFGKMYDFLWANDIRASKINVYPKQQKNDDESSIYFTDVSTFINGHEVPTFMFKGQDSHAVIVAEDLVNYGFDINFSSNTKTLYLTYNENKPFNSMPIEYYKGKNDELAYTIHHNDLNIILNDGIKEYVLKDIYNVNGYMCISVDELGRMYDFVWDNDSRSSKINIYSKKAVSQPAVENNKTIYFTDIKTYINEHEVPTFMFNGDNPHAVIVAEDLVNYGFDIDFDANTNTLSLTYNAKKNFTPMPMSYYRNKKDQKAYDIVPNNTKVVLNDGLYNYVLNDIYNVNGYMCISVDEFSKMYDFYWSNELHASKINVSQKQKPEYIYFTDVSTYLNNIEIPTFMYKGTAEHAVVIAEDLVNYGFDLTFNNEQKTLYLVYNQDKEVTPIPTDYYKGKKDNIAYQIIPNSIKVVLNDGLYDHVINDVYNVNGYMCISIDELAKIYNFFWSTENHAAYIDVVNKVNEIAILPDGSQLTSGSAYIMNYDTGEEIYAFKADEQKPVASIAKMMSVYVILDAIENGEISLDDIVPISENVYELSRNPNYKMMVNLEYDEEYTVDEMIDMIIIYSSAACVTAVAELISGSEEKFVERMNNKASEIGIDSVFYNGTGVCLNPETDKENLMSAKEVALMTRHMIQNYPDIVERTKCASVDFKGKTYYNLNKMFTDYYYKGADGFKNGMTDASGYCMCGTAILDGKRIITVTLPSDSNAARFTDTSKMFDYGFGVLGVDTSDVYDVPVQNTEEETEIRETAKEQITEKININIDGTYEMNFKTGHPYMDNGTVMVPLREMLEILERTVSWDAATNEIVVSDESTTLRLKAGSKSFKLETRHASTKALISSDEDVFEVAPVNKDGVTYCPLIETLAQFELTCTYEADNDYYLIVAGVC